ncbi:MAG: HAMP domain-containing protein [Methylococcaceae bacterium]|nr:HAMP domain-containing protein [Methylococcaceae bacterium]
MNIFQKLKESFLNIKIAYKFLIVLVAFVVGLAVIAFAFQTALNVAENTQKNATEQATVSNAIANVQFETLSAMRYEKSFRLSDSAADLKLFKSSLKKSYVELKRLTPLFTDAADKKLISTINSLLTGYEKAFLAATEAPLGQSDAQFNALNAITDKLSPEIAKLLNIRNKYNTAVQSQFEQAHSSIQTTFLLVIAIVPLVIILVLWGVVVSGIIKPVSNLQTVINDIAAGNLDTRVDASSKDEIGNLANAFDSLLDERVTSLAKTEYDHQQLNSSIISLLRSVSALSQKDLTIKVPVAEDMTGAVSDSINLLTQEMAEILTGVANISARVNTTSVEVKQQSANVMLYADNQRKEIEETLSELNTAVNTMIKIAKFSKVTNKESEKTMISTKSAEEAVSETIESINGIRDIIRETEKRIKRLGERSQEITGVVNIINNIAERTHVLSLNAGMQAASAGEAGKGFMVVANEVQRLAESSREATEKISTLVKNIQVDTSDTMKTMNTVISQVVDGTQRAEEAGERMKESRAITESLVISVKKIALTTIAQLDVGKSLKEHAQNIQTSTIKTNEQLQQQSKLSDDLVQNAEELIVKVNVFKLPE